jgi:hypothetical protein
MTSLVPAQVPDDDPQLPAPLGRSTGPRTPTGKAIVARNAVTHGIFAANPIVPGLDLPEEWEAHRAALLTSLAPEDDFQLALAERAVLLFWRLRRIARYETESTAAALEAVEDDVPRQQPGYLGVGGRPQDFRRVVAERRAVLQLLQDLPTLPATQRLTGGQIDRVFLLATEDEEDETMDDLVFPGLPAGVDVESFDGWTVALARDALRVIAGHRRVRPDALLDIARANASRLVEEAEDALRSAEVTARRLRRERILAPPSATDRIVRYEAHLHRLLVSTLHELEAAQARGRGQPAPLARLDVSTEGSET